LFLEIAKTLLAHAFGSLGEAVEGFGDGSRGLALPASGSFDFFFLAIE
jgi:hypothetical protein